MTDDNSAEIELGEVSIDPSEEPVAEIDPDTWYVKCDNCTWYGSVTDAENHSVEFNHEVTSEAVPAAEFIAAAELFIGIGDSRGRNFLEWMRGKSFSNIFEARRVYDELNDRPL